MFYSHEELAQELENIDLLEDFYGDQLKKKHITPEQFAYNHYKKLNNDQKEVFDEIASAVEGNNTQKLFFLEGDGGTGFFQ